MLVKRFSYFLLGSMMLLSQGCANLPGAESYKIGVDLEKQNRLEDSLCMLEEAVAKEKGNEEYSTACTRVKGRLLTQYTEKANKYLSVKPLTFGQLQLALGAAGKALKLNEGNVETQKLNDSIKRQISEMTSRAEALDFAATKAKEKNDWRSAAASLKEIKGFYPDYPELSLRLAMLTKSGADYYVKEADACKKKDDMAGAVQMLSYALELQPESQQTTKLLAEAKSQNSPDYYLTRAAESAQRQEWEKAMAMIYKAKEMKPGKDALARIESVQRDAVKFFLDRETQALSSGDLYACLENVHTSSSIRTGLARDAAETAVVEKLTQALNEKAEGYESAGKLGNALVWYEKARQLAGGDRRAYPKIQALKDKIKSRVIKKIAVMDFSAPSYNADAGRLVTDNLLSYLTKNASGDVKIFARDVLGAIVKEIEMGQAGLYDIESAKKAGKLKGTDLFIFGSVLQYNVEKSVEEGMKMVNALVGKRSTPNPAYQQWIMTHLSPTEKERKEAPLQTIEEDVREIVKYKVATHKKTANVSVSFRVIDVEEGEVVITKTLKNNKEVTDTYSEGVEFANIPFKELKLPSDSELLGQVLDATVSDLGYSVLSRFQNLQVVYSNNAKMLKKKGEYENAIEKFVDALSVEEVKNITTPLSDDVHVQIEALMKTISSEKSAKGGDGEKSALEAGGDAGSDDAEDEAEDADDAAQPPAAPGVAAAPVEPPQKPAGDVASSVK